MELLTILATCAALLTTAKPPETVIHETDCKNAKLQYQAIMRKIVLTEQERDAIARVAYAEAANQGDGGIAAVVYTIINRLISNQFGDSITDIINAPHQFEPAHKAGGWQHLPKHTQEQQARVDTIINLALAGHLPDVTKGALFFQNPKIVRQREKQGRVSAGLTDFGNSKRTTVIKDHAFYSSINMKKKRHPVKQPNKLNGEQSVADWDIYGKERLNTYQEKAQSWDVFSGEGSVR